MLSNLFVRIDVIVY